MRSLAILGTSSAQQIPPVRHCEERSDEAICYLQIEIALASPRNDRRGRDAMTNMEREGVTMILIA